MTTPDGVVFASKVDVDALKTYVTSALSNVVVGGGSGNYTKPVDGIPRTDLNADVRGSLTKADSALQTGTLAQAGVTSVNGQRGDVTVSLNATMTPATGSAQGAIRLAGDLAGTADAPSVPALASKVSATDARLSDARPALDGSVTDSSVATTAGISQSKIAGLVTALTNKADTSALSAKYTFPSGGIPKTDLDPTVQASLAKADTANQATAIVTGISIDGGATYSRGDVIVSSSGGVSIGDATSSAKGLIQLTGDLGGTAASPTVPGLATKADATATTTALAGKVDTSDSRLTDTRTPTDGTVTDAKVASNAAIAESKLNLASDAAANVASRRTLGTGALQAAAGNDSRLSDTRTPTDASVDDSKVKANAQISENKLNLASDGPAGTPTRRTLGTGATQAAAGNDIRFSDARTPLAASVTDASVATNANIAQSKINGLATALGAKYTTPSGGIPKTDMAAAVQTSLGKADTALQSAPVTSVNGATGVITLNTDVDPGVVYNEPTYNGVDFLIHIGVPSTYWGVDAVGQPYYETTGTVADNEKAIFDQNQLTIQKLGEL